MDYSHRRQAKDTVTAVLTTDEQSAQRLADRFAEAFVDEGPAVGLADAGHGQWQVTLYFPAAVEEAAVRKVATTVAGAGVGKALRFDRLPAKDWVAESLVNLSAVTAGRFLIHGAHHRGLGRGRIAVEIDAAQAFGTGHHGSTRGCLLMLDEICKTSGTNHQLFSASFRKGQRPRRHDLRLPPTAPPTRSVFARRLPSRGGNLFPRILDLGTGSGVLAIAAAKSLRRPVLASDIDAQAVRIARDNARLNGSAGLVRVWRAHGIAAQAIRAAAPFDLVFANILLAPLQRLAAPLTGMVAPRGRLVLSGLLNKQANAARAAYPQFTLERRIAVEGWTTLVLRRSSTLPGRRRPLTASTPPRLHLPIDCR